MTATQPKLRRGMSVPVFQSWMTGEVFEGRAILKKSLDQHEEIDGKQFGLWLVKFPGDGPAVLNQNARSYPTAFTPARVTPAPLLQPAEVKPRQPRASVLISGVGKRSVSCGSGIGETPSGPALILKLK